MEALGLCRVADRRSDGHSPIEPWRYHAACAGGDQDLFFPEPGDGPAVAKAVCGTCPMCHPGLDYVLADPTLVGVWGGYTERERRKLRTGRQPADRPSPDEEQTARREPRRERKPCGTAAAYARHRRRGEAAYDACKEAKRRKFAQTTRRRRKLGKDDETDRVATG